MDYFKKLQEFLSIEREEDKLQYQRLTEQSSVIERRANGLTWYPIAIKGTEISRGDYITVEVERPTNQDISHQFRTGVPAALFSNHDSRNDRAEGTISYVGNNRLKITLRTDELPEWSKDGKLGVDVLFDDNSYDEMQAALKQAATLAETKDGTLVQILTGSKKPTFKAEPIPFNHPRLNASQNTAVEKILTANDLAIVHGPPGTGKTTTLVQAIKALIKQEGNKILVCAPSNAAVDLLSDKLSQEGINVVRIGNPARVSERLMSLTLDHKMAEHDLMKEAKKLKKQAQEYKNMAHKYKRNFGREEREQRKLLFDEAHKILKEIGKTEQYIIEDITNKAQVITATLVGANHYTIADMKFHTAIIDEAGQALEPACWIPILKAQKVILAGDHCQLPPTIKSIEAAQRGFNHTLLEKCVALHPEAVSLLTEQYRMHEHIMGYSSRVFYQNRLQAHSSVANHLLHTTDKPVAFIDTAGCGFDEKLDGTSTTNPEEASLLIKHLTQLVTELQSHYTLETFPSIAIISPYKQQVNVIKDLLDHSPDLEPYMPRIAVNTVDSFQGQERDIVYISMTRSNEKGEIGFLSDIRRMNVAMTRARKKLIVIGDSATLAQFPFYGDFISYSEGIDAYQSAWEFV
ncbi:AAA domain-containing protein [Xanthocytophaga flava]|uniref:AAA domain-containing protein n=1 Tax=Xanthocytophaga flava TaxID=3048013 RepID=UPI0028D770BB|nr:AAA domain-containing protein [Xanthocytophaga flavus]MDJ1466226.1 AAA domain-containing protein [Xanthocytophaga flavus]